MSALEVASVMSPNQDRAVIFMGDNGSAGEYRQSTGLAEQTQEELKDQGEVLVFDFSFHPAAASYFIRHLRELKALLLATADGANEDYRNIIRSIKDFSERINDGRQ